VGIGVEVKLEQHRHHTRHCAKTRTHMIVSLVEADFTGSYNKAYQESTATLNLESTHAHPRHL
jgi:hypothetical protein